MIEYRIETIDSRESFAMLDKRLMRLPEWRREIALSFRQPHDRLQSAVAYEVLCALLEDISGMERHDILLVYDRNGKPSLSGREDIYISLSHCPCGVMAAVADVPIGCDIEAMQRPLAENQQLVAEYCFSNPERQKIASSSDPVVEFTRIWTVKEALFKLDNTIDIENVDTENLYSYKIKSLITDDYVASIALL